jgi:hypothetical protein
MPGRAGAAQLPLGHRHAARPAGAPRCAGREQAESAAFATAACSKANPPDRAAIVPGAIEAGHRPSQRFVGIPRAEPVPAPVAEEPNGDVAHADETTGECCANGVRAASRPRTDLLSARL